MLDIFENGEDVIIVQRDINGNQNTKEINEFFSNDTGRNKEEYNHTVAKNSVWIKPSNEVNIY